MVLEYIYGACIPRLLYLVYQFIVPVHFTIAVFLVYLLVNIWLLFACPVILRQPNILLGIVGSHEMQYI